MHSRTDILSQRGASKQRTTVHSGESLSLVFLINLHTFKTYCSRKSDCIPSSDMPSTDSVPATPWEERCSSQHILDKRRRVAFTCNPPFLVLQYEPPPNHSILCQITLSTFPATACRSLCMQSGLMLCTASSVPFSVNVMKCGAHSATVTVLQFAFAVLLIYLLEYHLKSLTIGLPNLKLHCTLGTCQ